LSGADQADCFAVHVEPDQAVESEIAFPDAIIRAMHFPVERQHKSDGVFGDRVRRVRRNAHHRNPMLCRGSEIDTIVTSTAQRDQSNA
jgi:hypothetical protein